MIKYSKSVIYDFICAVFCLFSLIIKGILNLTFSNNLGKMRKPTTIIIESLPSLRTSDLKHWDTISNQHVSGKNNSLGHLKLTYELTREGLYLDYCLNGFNREQWIEILIEPSNLGIGEVWYFRCPVTEKKCRKLVFWRGAFIHQSAIENHFYRQQTESAPKRTSMKWIRRYHEYQSLLKHQKSPYYKRTYAGNSTRLAVRATKALHRYAAALNNEKEVWMWIKGTRNTEKK